MVSSSADSQSNKSVAHVCVFPSIRSIGGANANFITRPLNRPPSLGNTNTPTETNTAVQNQKPGSVSLYLMGNLRFSCTKKKKKKRVSPDSLPQPKKKLTTEQKVLYSGYPAPCVKAVAEEVEVRKAPAPPPYLMVADPDPEIETGRCSQVGREYVGQYRQIFPL